jgi:hypothetical protein
MFSVTQSNPTSNGPSTPSPTPITSTPLSMPTPTFGSSKWPPSELNGSKQSVSELSDSAQSPSEYNSYAEYLPQPSSGKLLYQRLAKRAEAEDTHTASGYHTIIFSDLCTYDLYSPVHYVFDA